MYSNNVSCFNVFSAWFLRYQHIDGSCNNLINPLAGAAITPFKRLLPPLYGDGKAVSFSDLSDIPYLSIVNRP